MGTPEEIAAWRKKNGIGTDGPITPPTAPVAPVSDLAARDAALARMGATPTGDQWANLGIPEFMPGVEPKPQLTPEQHMVQGNALPWMMGAVFDIPGQTGAELFSQIPKIATGRWDELEAPTLFTEGATSTIEKFWDRPIWQQFLLGAAFDPLGPPIGLGTIRGLGRAALRGLGRGAADAAIPTPIPGQRALPPARPEAAAAIPGRVGPPLSLPGRVGQEVVGYGPSTTPERYVPMRDVGAQRALGPGVPPDPTPPPPRQTPALTGRVSPIEQAGQVADPRILNFIPRVLRQTARGQVIGSTGVEQPAVFYRSTGTAGQQRVVSYSATRPGAMILEDAPGAVVRGGGVEAVGLKAGSRVLQEGTKDFVSVVGRQRAAESPADFVKRATNAAKEAGYDMVQFSRQPAVRNVLLNEDAVIRNYVTPRTPSQVLRPAAAAVRPVVSEVGQRMLGPGQGVGAGTAETVGRVAPGTVISDRPGVQRISVKRDPTIPYEATGRGEGFAREILRGEIAAASDVGTPVWAVTPDGQVFNLPSANQPGAAAMDVSPVRPRTLDFIIDTNGDTIIVPNAQAPRTGPMTEAWKRNEISQIERRSMSSEAQLTPEGAAAVDQAADAFEAAEIVARLESTPDVRPRPRREGRPFGDDVDNPFPRKPEEALSDAMALPTHEAAHVGIMRLFDGARNAMGLAVEKFVLEGRDKLTRFSKTKALNITREGMLPLFRALHGEIPKEQLSPPLQEIFDDITKLRNTEQADMKAFLAKNIEEGTESLQAVDLNIFQQRMLATPHYFPQLWKSGDTPLMDMGESAFEAELGRAGSNPDFARGRAGSFDEMLELGFEPISWDPYKVMAMRRMAGVEWRETIVFLNRSIQNELAFPADQVSSLTHRVPSKVGSVFEGYRFAASTDQSGITSTLAGNKWAFPNEMAGFIETMWGRKPRLEAPTPVGTRDMLPLLRKFRNGFKSAKLFASFFQHADIFFRATYTSFAPRELLGLKPIGIPSLMKRMVLSQVSTAHRAKIRDKFLSSTPIKGHEDLGISYKMMVEQGLGVQGDITVIQRELADTLQDIQQATNPVGAALQKINNANKFFQSGLFDGVYREGIMHGLESFIIPQTRRQHPTWNAQQVAAEAASKANLMFSSMPQWQTMLKNPALREFMQTMFFSTNESEGLLRQFFGTAVGNQKSFWMQYHAGMFISLAFFANLIHASATKEFLPWKAYTPVDIDNPYGPLQIPGTDIGLGYNSRFLSPQIPLLRGRNDTPIYVDLVGQMDTSLRILLDPGAATAARINVAPRAVANQMSGRTFFGEELGGAFTPEGFGRRSGQAFTDLFGPIGGMSALSALAEGVPELKTVLPEGEARLGWAGQLIQAGGLGFRAERTGEFLDRMSSDIYKEDVTYGGMEQFQKIELREIPQVAEELGLRQEATLKREGAEGNYYAALDAIDGERTAKLMNLVLEIQQGMNPRQVHDQFQNIETFARGRRKQAAVDQAFDAQDVNDSDPNKRALAQYFAIYDHKDVKKPGDDVDFAMFDAIYKQRYVGANAEEPWTEEQFKYVMRNTNTRPIPFTIFNHLGAKTQMKQQMSQLFREQFYREMGRNDLADVSRNRFYMLDELRAAQPVMTAPQATPQPQAPVPQPAQRSSKQEQIEAWRQKNLVGANR